jgi:hypothetical protein
MIGQVVADHPVVRTNPAILNFIDEKEIRSFQRLF